MSRNEQEKKMVPLEKTVCARKKGSDSLREMGRNQNTKEEILLGKGVGTTKKRK